MAAKGIRPSGSGKAGGPGKPGENPKAAGNGPGTAKVLGSKSAPAAQKAPGVDKPVAKGPGTATTMAASASNVRLMRGQRATGMARMTMLLRSIKPTGRQQLTASAIATAATSRTPSMG